MKNSLLLFLSIYGCFFTSYLFSNLDDFPSTIEELKIEITKIAKERKIPGLAIAMTKDDGSFWIETFGKANIESDIPTSQETLFRIGSITKMFVALSVLKLVEEGKLFLNDNVADLVPDVQYENQWKKTDPIKVVHLLEHTTGWDDFHLVEYSHNDPTPISLKQGLDFHPQSRVSRWKPGTRMSYCNSGPPVAAYIVEKITGQDFEAYVKENFFDPMGMETITFRLSEDVKENGATLYSQSVNIEDYWHVLMRPAGSINSSIKDMAKFLEFFLNRGKIFNKQIISKASLNRMESVQSTSAAKVGQQIGYGLHNYSTPYKHWVYKGHNGGIGGGKAELAYLPEANKGHVILLNTDDPVAFKEISDLLCEYETKNLPVKEIIRELEITADYKEIEGYYYPINSRNKALAFFDQMFNIQTLSFKGGELVQKGLLHGDPVYFFPVTKALFKSKRTGYISLSKVKDPIDGDVIHSGTQVLKPTSLISVYFSLAIVHLWQALIAASFLFFPVWIIRKLRKKLEGKTISVRLWPLLSGISAVIMVGLFTYGIHNPIKYLGVPSLVSISLMVSTIIFALCSLMGVYTSLNTWNAQMNKVNYWFSTLCSTTHLTVAIYLFFQGFIGIMTWR